MAPLIGTPAEIASVSEKGGLPTEGGGGAGAASTPVPAEGPAQIHHHPIRPDATLHLRVRDVPGALHVTAVSPYATSRRLLENQIYLVERKERYLYYVPVDTRKMCKAAAEKRRRLVRDLKVPGVPEAELTEEEWRAYEESMGIACGMGKELRAEVERGMEWRAEQEMEARRWDEEGEEVASEGAGESRVVKGAGLGCGCALM